MLMLLIIAALIMQNLKMLFAIGVGIRRNCLCVQRLVIKDVVPLNACLGDAMICTPSLEVLKIEKYYREYLVQILCQLR